jgi:SAM-dependent methyltransferase
METRFTKIYDKNIWGGSGGGSKFTADNKKYLKNIKEIIDEFKIENICDLGCGDWEIMKHFNLGGLDYYGLDCVKSVINANRKYEKENIKFDCKDFSKEIPKGYDLIILKDVIQHWKDEEIYKFLPKLLRHNKFVYCVNGYKFMRKPEKNNWVKREIDKRYKFHPIEINRPPLNKFWDNVVNISHRRCKEYILFKGDTTIAISQHNI